MFFFWFQIGRNDALYSYAWGLLPPAIVVTAFHVTHTQIQPFNESG